MTREELVTINDRYIKCGHHWLNEIDVSKANSLINLIESTRSVTEPKPGDILRFTDRYGEVYPCAHIEKESLRVGGNICYHAYVPFITERKDGTGIRCSASGGSWNDVSFPDMRYVGKAKKRFCFWGSSGPCADGAVEIEAEVSVWEYAEELIIPGYTTETYDRFWLTDSGEDSRRTRESGYRYHISRSGTPYRAFKNKEDLNAWIKTFRGKIFDRGEKNSSVVWTWKAKERHVSPAEFDEIPALIDTMIFNGAVRQCKRIYSFEKHTVTTYFVWYWEEPGDFYEVLAKQNEIRKNYELPWDTPEFMLAR
jgi:hypothetical protein